jgi:Tfp pilus assembly protein PilX
MNKNNRGQVLLAVAAALVVLTIVVLVLVQWLGNDMKWSLGREKSTDAINLAEAGINRAQWKLQSSTSTWAAAIAGQVITGYDFDTTYTDIAGGTYRIMISSPSSSNQTVMITSEGRDNSTLQTRAISAVYKNLAIYSPLMANGNITWGSGLVPFWGPVMSQGNIALSSDAVAMYGFPRKLANGVVTGTAAHPRDTNGLLPPNTDNVEWWSSYQGVPNVPVLDFIALRSSAAVTGTLNVYGCRNSGSWTYTNNTPSPFTVHTANVNGPWDLRASCGSSNATSPNNANTPHSQHFGDSTNYVASELGDVNHTKNYVWYWDGDLTLTGACGYAGNKDTALRGIIIVMGNLTIDSGGDLVYNGHVPTNAWMDQEEELAATYSGGVQTAGPVLDTFASGAWYPADTGVHQNSATWNFGNTGAGAYQWQQPGSGNAGWFNTVGLKGFVYVGKNLYIDNFLDINGAVWINGAVTSNYASATSFCGVLYDDTLQVPTLNVILVQQSWQEVTPSSTPWH